MLIYLLIFAVATFQVHRHTRQSLENRLAKRAFEDPMGNELWSSDAE